MPLSCLQRDCGIIWVLLFVGAGYGFGATPFVKRNFQLVILAIIVNFPASVAWEIFASRRAAPERRQRP